MTKSQKAKRTLEIKKIFDMVYQWGQVGVVVDYKSEAYLTSVYKLLGEKHNGVHKVGATYLECYIPNCPKKHLPF